MRNWGSVHSYLLLLTFLGAGFTTVSGAAPVVSSTAAASESSEPGKATVSDWQPRSEKVSEETASAEPSLSEDSEAKETAEEEFALSLQLDGTATPEPAFDNPAEVSPVPVEDDEPFAFQIRMDQLSMTWILGGNNKIGMFSLENKNALGLGGPEEFTTSFEYGIHFLDGPTRTDLPPRLFDFHVGARWMKWVDSTWGFDLFVAPGIYSDFEDSSREGWRIVGRGLVYYNLTPSVQLALGVEYLDRDNVKLLPAGGLILKPDDETRLELYFPRPRLARRIGTDANTEKWLYLSGEYGGGSWVIERVTGLKDVITSSDLRLMLGIERKSKDRDSFIEFGYIFDRKLEFRSRIGNYRPSDTFMIRFGDRY